MVRARQWPRRGRRKRGRVATSIHAGEDAGRAVGIRNGKIYVGGYTWTGTNFDFAIVRYTGSGALDGAFGEGGIVTADFSGTDDRAWGMAIQTNGRVALAGSTINGSQEFAVARY